MELRVLSILSIFISSIIGSIGFYVISKNQKFNDTFLKSLINLFSAGVILSLSLVHITNEVIIELHEYINFPLGACCVLIGLLSMLVFDNMSHSWNQ